MEGWQESYSEGVMFVHGSSQCLALSCLLHNFLAIRELAMTLNLKLHVK